MTEIPEKLTPVPLLDRSLLPAWVEDVGSIPADAENPDGVFVMTARARNGDLLHCNTPMAGITFDDTFWERYAAPMVSNLGGAIFESEWPDMFGQSLRWEAEAAIGRRKLNSLERQVIARRKELVWETPA